MSFKGPRVGRRGSALRINSQSIHLSRNSSTARAIKIFADVRELLGISGSSHIRLSDNPKIKEGCLASFADEEMPISNKNEEVDRLISQRGLQAPENISEKDVRSPSDSSGPQQSLTQSAPPIDEEKRDKSDSPNIYEYFPKPPARVLRSSHRSVSAQYVTVDSTPESTDNSGSSMAERKPPRINKLLPQSPYHSFTRGKKTMIVVLVSLAGSLSPLSSIIYFPVITAIASKFEVSKELVLLSITAFMMAQGMTPVVRLPFESVGRRPVLVSTLFVFSGASMGLVFSRRIFVHIVLRAVQAGGSAALTSIGAAIIGDISTTKERTRFMAIFSAVLIGSHFVSPVIGGALTNFVGFQSIFWFLFIFATTIMVLIILLLPETLRSIAGNGTVKLGLMHRPFWSIFKSRDTPFNPNINSRTCRPSISVFQESFGCFRQKNLTASTVFGSVVYAVLTTVISTTTFLFQERYHLSAFFVGFAFLPAGAGSVLSFYATGFIMDRDYRIVEFQYRKRNNIDQSTALDLKSLPICMARLRSLWWIALIFLSTTAGYGFSFLSPSIAVPLVLQFLIAFSATAVLFLNGVLVADTYPGSSSSVIVAMNMIRFSCGALAVGTVQLLFNRLGYGFTFLMLSMIVVAVMPILLVQWVFGSGRERDRLTWRGWPSNIKSFSS